VLVDVVYEPESEEVVEMDEGHHAGTVTPSKDSALASFTIIRQCLTSLAIRQTRFIFPLRLSLIDCQYVILVYGPVTYCRRVLLPIGQPKCSVTWMLSVAEHLNPARIMTEAR